MAKIDGKEVALDVTLVTRVSLAVELIDSYTGQQPRGRVRVFLQAPAREGKLNPGGYFLFLNLPDGSYTLQVESEHYREEKRPFNIPASPPENPVLRLALIPRPSYPFPPGATLIRGMVRDAAEMPVRARVEVVGKGLEYENDERGEFVLAFGDLKEADVIQSNGKTFVKGNGGTKIITLKATPSGLGSKTLDITAGVEEGQTTSASITF